tara:strand:+ start:388 stop:600 length:213 start_codon:yes stop_codon:yes gene_type:complete
MSVLQAKAGQPLLLGDYMDIIEKRNNLMLEEYWTLVKLYSDSEMAINVAARRFNVASYYLVQLLNEKGIH